MPSNQANQRVTTFWQVVCYEVGHYKTTCDLRKSDKLAEYFVQDDHASEAGDENIEEGDEDYDSEEPDDDDGYEVYNEYLEDDTD